MEKEVYDIQDVINAEILLTPIKCRYCGHVGEVEYNQKLADGQCGMCGQWQIDEIGS